jgi:hypothetical protein
MVAAMSSYLYLELMRSAALRKIAARSAKGRLSQKGFAAKAESIACWTSDADALEYLAMGVECDEGFDCVRIEDVLT